MLIHVPIYCAPGTPDDVVRYLIELELACLDSYFAHGNTHDVLVTTNDRRPLDVLSAYRANTQHAFDLLHVSRDELMRAFGADDDTVMNEACVKMIFSKFYPVLRRLDDSIVHIDLDTLFLQRVNFSPLLKSGIGVVDCPFLGNLGWHPTPQEVEFFRVDKHHKTGRVRNWLNTGVFAVRGRGFDICEIELKSYIENLQHVISTNMIRTADELILNMLALRDSDTVSIISDYGYNFLAYYLCNDPLWSTNGKIVHFHSTKPHVFREREGMLQCECVPEHEGRISRDFERACMLWCTHLHAACRKFGYETDMTRDLPLHVVQRELRRLTDGGPPNGTSWSGLNLGEHVTLPGQSAQGRAALDVATAASGGGQAIPARASSDLRVCVIVSCKGRRSFLESTVHRVLAHPAPRYCLVDYSCPEDCGAWIQQRFAAESRDARVIVEFVPGQAGFNKSAAFNAGARRAIRDGADYLCFLDADTIIEPDFFDWLLTQVSPGRFLVVALDEDRYDVPSLTGVLVIASSDFQKTDGFDESFEGWGAEDIEFRLRLHVLHGLQYADIPLALVRPLEHDDTLRTAFYTEKQKENSNRQNSARMEQKLRHWASSGYGGKETQTAQRLMYQARPRSVRPADGDRENRELFAHARMCCMFGRYEEALAAYEKRLSSGGWEEEVWCSLYQKALIELKIGGPWGEVERSLLRAQMYRPCRAEPLWVLAVCSRQAGRYAKAYHFARSAAEISEPADSLLVQRDVYQWRALEEYTLCAFHVGELEDALAATRLLLERPSLPGCERERIQANEALFCQHMSAAEHTEGLERNLHTQGSDEHDNVQGPQFGASAVPRSPAPQSAARNCTSVGTRPF